MFCDLCNLQTHKLGILTLTLLVCTLLSVPKHCLLMPVEGILSVLSQLSCTQSAICCIAPAMLPHVLLLQQQLPCQLLYFVRSTSSHCGSAFLPVRFLTAAVAEAVASLYSRRAACTAFISFLFSGFTSPGRMPASCTYTLTQYTSYAQAPPQSSPELPELALAERYNQ